MKRLNQMIAMGLIGMAGLVFINGCAQHQRTLTIRAFIDGSDVFKISGSRLWIEHSSFSLPGNPIYVNGKPWTPKWDDKTSSELAGFSPAFFTSNPQKIQLTQKAGRGTVSIEQLPSADNNQTLAVRFDDNDFEGAGWYEIVISW